jgi:thiol-disulfide isomerase/thioredoxin
MKKLFASLLGLTCLTAASAVEIGATAEEVTAELGKPESQLAAGKRTVLNYPEVRVVLEDGVVVERKKNEVDRLATAPGEKPAPAKPAPAVKPRPSAAPAAAAQWTTDYTAALAQAKNDKTKVFLFFTGSDWCGWCVRLKEEVLSQPDFMAYAQQNLVLVDIDFPREVEQPDALAAQNKKLSRKYNIEGFPTVVVLNSSGKEIGRLGYQPGGPAAFIQQLESL